MMTMSTTLAAQKQHCSKASFISLPTEILQVIFLSLPDVTSLKSVLLSCSLFYYTFVGAQPIILNRLLCNQIGSDMMPIAFILSKSYDIQPFSKVGVLDYLSCLHDYRSCKLPMWTLPNALRISKLHHHVEFFANDFASDFAIARFPGTAPGTPSVQEKHRLHRTLYLLELYHILFCSTGLAEKVRISAADQHDLFFAKFAPWENEQLGCMYDYLYDQLYLGACSLEPTEGGLHR